MERLIWWLSLVLFFLFFLILGLGLVAFLVAFPEGAAFILGFLGFYLLANRLIFAYGGMLAVLGQILRKEEIDKRALAGKINQPIEKLEELTESALVALWMAAVDPFRYAYYGIFMLMLLFTILFKLNIFGNALFGAVVEGAFWGSALVTFFVFSLELFVGAYLEEAMGV